MNPCESSCAAAGRCDVADARAMDPRVPRDQQSRWIVERGLGGIDAPEALDLAEAPPVGGRPSPYGPGRASRRCASASGPTRRGIGRPFAGTEFCLSPRSVTQHPAVTSTVDLERADAAALSTPYRGRWPFAADDSWIDDALRGCADRHRLLDVLCHGSSGVQRLARRRS